MASIDVYVGEQHLRRLLLRRGATRIGRVPDGNDLSFAELGVADLSSHHLEIVCDGGSVRARDLGSKNGTRRNGAPMIGEVALEPGDELRAGSMVRLVLVPDDLRGLLALQAEHDALRWALERLGRLHRARSATEVLRIVVREASADSGAAVAWALLWSGDDRARSYRVLVHEGETDAVPPPSEIPTSVVGRAVGLGRAVWTDDATSDPRFRQSESVRALRLGAVGAVPIGEGAVLYLSREGAAFGPAPRARVEALCGLAARFLEGGEEEGAPRPPEEAREVLPGVVSRSAVMRELAGQIRTFARLGYRVLLTGERGTGKSMLARAMHELSGVKGEFVHGDCPNLVPTLAESLLFGHERGAFAGAVQRHVGWVERANGGTLFLDEVGDLPMEVQPKLLALLEEGTFERVGGDRRLSFTGRVLAATNRAVGDPSVLRRDLYDRLAQVVLRVPSLSERPEDVLLLAQQFFAEEAARIAALGVAAPEGLSEGAIGVLERMPIEGNVRALRSMVVRSLGLALVDGSPRVCARHLVQPSGEPSEAEPRDYWAQVHAFERSLLVRALAACDGNQTRARGLLGLSNGAWDRAKKRAGL